VVVGSNAAPLGFLGAYGRHEHGQLAGVLAGSESPTDLEAGNARQHPREDDKVRQVFD
jgi:hypothetical protein